MGYGHASIDLALSLGKTVAQILADFSPVPGLSPAAEVLCAIVELCEQIKVNRSAARQLRDRSHELLLALKESTKDAPNSLHDAIQATEYCLQSVQIQMHGWTMLTVMETFLRYKDISHSIEKCHEQISDCMTAFQLNSHIGIHRWQEEFAVNSQQDHSELVRYLSDIKSSQETMASAVRDNNDMARQIMQMMQSTMADNRNTANRVHSGLSSNLYKLQEASGGLLPNMKLEAGEVTRLGRFPVKGTPTMDVYEGIYLGHRKVAIKVVRAVTASAADKTNRRFMREVKIWTKVWGIDKGRHILPFLGFGQNDDEPFPFMVTPWPDRGDALEYIKTNQLEPTTYMTLVRGIGQGLQVLHSMEPPVVHGDIRAVNIAIDARGRPLLADFGLSQILEDITGAPYTQSRGIASDNRWFAPEVCMGEGMLSRASDIYAYGMTILELLTHQQPYREVRHTPEVVIMSNLGRHPKRPTEPHIIARGLNDDLWMMMTACWNLETSNRPTIDELLSAFGE